jgi:hypothetical protein
LRAAGEIGLSRTQLRDLFDRNTETETIETALALLQRRLLAEPRQAATGGRPAERWYAREFLAPPGIRPRA